MKKIIAALILFALIGCGTSQSLIEKLISEHPEWTNEEIALIVNKEIEIGMTKEMVNAAWAKPNHINKINSAYNGKTEAWTYYSIFTANLRTVTFQENEVTMFNESKPN